MTKALYILAGCLLCIGCAKTTTENTGSIAKQTFEAWLEINYPEQKGKSVFPGYYILEDEAGTGADASGSGVNPYAYICYTSYDTEGDISQTTYEATSDRIGEYLAYGYYGPIVLARGYGNCNAGIDAVLSGMKEGGRKKVIVPPWLMTTSRYDSEQEYINNYSSASTLIYDVRLVKAIADVNAWQIDSIENHCRRSFGQKLDSLKYGFYKKQLKAPTDTSSFSSDTTVYINYVCRRLDGKAVDSNIRDTAAKYRFIDDSGTYEPVQINWGSSYSDITMTSSKTSVIDGFAYLLWTMRAYEKATGVFYSGLGYGSTSTSAIPAYSPLQFEIELVDKQ